MNLSNDLKFKIWIVSTVTQLKSFTLFEGSGKNTLRKAKGFSYALNFNSKAEWKHDHTESHVNFDAITYLQK